MAMLWLVGGLPLVARVSRDRRVVLVLLACVDGLTFLACACACAFDGFLL